MKSSNRNILVLFKQEFMSEQALERQVESLNDILSEAESLDRFCEAHEMVDRNLITSNRKKIIKETGFATLRQFRFLINKN